ncbi:MAG TPA: dihydrolipoamide acetyltransferase family protein [Acidimicrobiales bacterium]|nr:dihydrolipoamide acetyltransferase family protein [Acidimicrobiales bacterium]
MPDVTMPQLGETVTEGTITRWMKSVGDQVDRDEPLFEVSTDKVDSEVPAPASGVLSEILVPEGETVAVGARLAVIADGAGGVATSAPGTPVAEAQPQAPAPEPAAPPEPDAAPAPPPAATAPPAPSAVPASAAPPPASPPPPPGGFIPRAGEEAAPPAAGDGAARSAGAEGMLLSPVVRRLLEENAISPAEVTGTGLGGRITREDVLALLDTRRGPGAPAPAAAQPPPAAAAQPAPAAAEAPAPQAPPPAAAPAPAAQAAAVVSAPPQMQPAATAVFRPATDRVIPFSNMRRRTAEHMVRSKATSPHAFIAYEADFENVERVRKVWRERFKSEEGFSLTYLPFIARATVEALREFPNLNASVAEDSLVVHQQVNLGIAVDLNHEGLIVPVVHHAEEITLRGIARRIRDLADRARNRQLTADDIAGGTFSITNDGPFGTLFTVPIINQPQVAILATDGVRRRPIVIELPDGSESISVHSIGVIGLSWDHRAVDGAYVSSFLQRVAQVLATRDWASEL